MYRNTKIATCCYCGTRAALVLSEDHRILACMACGAPLRILKSLPCESFAPAGPPGQAARPAAAIPARGAADRPAKKKKPKKIKKKKSRLHNLIDEIYDEIEDIFD